MNIDRSICSKKRFPDYLFFFGVLVPLFAVFSSARFFGRGADYNGYLAIFYGDDSTEPAFRLLKSVNAFITGGAETLAFVYFVASFVGLWLKGALYKRYSCGFLLSVFLYVSTVYFLHEYTQIRAAVALGICYLSVEEINKGRFPRFAVRILFAMCFHYSSVVMFAVYFYCHLFKKPKRYIQFLWLSFIGCIALYAFLDGESLCGYFGAAFYERFFSLGKQGHISVDALPVFNIGYIFISVASTIYYVTYKGFRRKNIDFTIFQLATLSPIMYFLLSNVGFPVIAYRFSEFFIPFVFIVIPKIIRRFKERFLFAPFVLVVLVYYARVFYRAVFA